MTPRLRIPRTALARALGAAAHGGGETVELPVDAPRWLGGDAPVRRGTTDADGACLIVCESADAAPADGTPWMTLEADDEALAWRIDRALVRLAGRPGVPGTLVRIHGHGVLLRGAEGTGKSHTALALLDRGHALVADDLVTLAAASATPEGRAPDEGPRGRLAVRGLGVIRVDEHFGDAALARRAPVVLEVVLAPGASADPLTGGWATGGLLGRPLPRLTLAPGPMTALLIEAAVRECRQAGGITHGQASAEDRLNAARHH
ncbi:HPr kinase/phosphorylase [Arhodomonas aquaeolei]|uniref:HPr kinase/phosphorylase n=1 Tax=Arhodomonas aquaeolei TaxID=2369 RepID=UPI000377521C|nr:HPr kinase/phosphatase C-terminal domain-containing protein [Arhodomonas aquaeolei]